jgi:site-specific recombinase XerD
MLRMDYIGRHPFTGISNVRVEQKVIQPLSEDEIRALLAVCNPETEFGCRSRAMILLLLDTGIRKSELNRLDLMDVDLESRRIHIRHGKGRKQRIVAFGDAPSDVLAAYIIRFRGDMPGALFLSVSSHNRNRHSVNPDHLSTLLERLGKQAGVHANPQLTT